MFDLQLLLTALIIKTGNAIAAGKKANMRFFNRKQFQQLKLKKLT